MTEAVSWLRFSECDSSVHLRCLATSLAQRGFLEEESSRLKTPYFKPAP